MQRRAPVSPVDFILALAIIYLGIVLYGVVAGAITASRRR